ncbi:MAG: phosphatase PAP2 family protein [Chthoniobacteraceae bacterium]
MKLTIQRAVVVSAILFSALLALPGAAWGQTAAPAAPSAAKASASPKEATGYYLTGAEKPFATFPPAPRLNSESDHTDLLITLAAQGSRNSDQIQEAWADRSFSESQKALDHLVDPAFETTYPETSAVAALVKRGCGDGALILHALKKRFQRPRPFVQHPGLVVPLFPVADFSYPSGHSAGAELRALLLSELFPDRAAALLEKAHIIADSRVVAGVHYESDIEAGLNLGDLVFAELKKNPKFRQDLAVAKAQVAGK